MVLPLLKKKAVYPIGIDFDTQSLKMAQLAEERGQLRLVAAANEDLPEDIRFGSADWQHWALRSIKKMLSDNKFKGKGIVTGLSSEDLFIDQVKLSRNDEDIQKAVIENIRQRLPFSPENAMIKSVLAQHNSNGNGRRDVVVMAAEKVKVERQLAIYEKVNLEIKGISVWPLAITNTYVNFFGRRESDKESVVILLHISSKHSHVVISKHSNLLFARVVPIGFLDFNEDKDVERLMAELANCARYFESVSGGTRVNRLIFLSGRSVEVSVCDQIAEFAKKMHISAQVGDVLAAVDYREEKNPSVDRRVCRMDWATSFGLSLSASQ